MPIAVWGSPSLFVVGPGTPWCYLRVMAKKKDPHAVALGRKGGTAAAGAGLKARYAAMTKEERRQLAKRAALARWKKRTRKKK